MSEQSQFAVYKGYAAVFGNRDQQGDVIEKNAFKRTIDHQPTKPLLLGHDVNEVIGWIDLTTDSYGLRANCRILNSLSRGADVVRLIDERLIGGLSIGFRIPAGGASYDKDTRRLTELDVLEVSACLFPANALALIDGASSPYPPAGKTSSRLGRTASQVAGDKVSDAFEKLLRLLESNERTERRASVELLPGTKFEFSGESKQITALREQLRYVSSQLRADAPKDEDAETRKLLDKLLAAMRSA